MQKTKKNEMKNLAPAICRQRLVIEAIPAKPVTDLQIKDYLTKLSEQLKMKTLIEPVTHRSDLFGWAGWIHWETSGAHFYAWETPKLFMSVDIYTCKEFKESVAVDFTKEYFKTSEIVSKGF